MHRILHLPMRPKLSLDILIAQQPHLRGQMLPVRAEEPTVEVDWRQQCHWPRGEAVLDGHCCCHEQTGRWSHDGWMNRCFAAVFLLGWVVVLGFSVVVLWMVDVVKE